MYAVRCLSVQVNASLALVVHLSANVFSFHQLRKRTILIVVKRIVVGITKLLRSDAHEIEKDKKTLFVVQSELLIY